MHDPLSMRLVKRVSDLDAMAEDLRGRERAPLDALRQGLALEVLHHEVLESVQTPYVIENAYVRVVEAGDRACLALEPLAPVGVRAKFRSQDLDRDDPMEPRVARPIALHATTGTDWSRDLVGPESRSRGKRHRTSGVRGLEYSHLGLE